MQGAATREEEDRTAPPVEFFGLGGQIPKCYPSAAIAIRDCERSAGAHRARICEDQQPGVAIDELCAMTPICGDLLLRGVRIDGTEQGDQFVTGKAPRVDSRALCATELDVGNAEL